MNGERGQPSCTPCQNGGTALKGEAIHRRLKQLHPDWRVVNHHHLERQFNLQHFHRALNFINQIGELAEREGHHPELTLSSGKVGITLFTHKLDGLSENDFILAAKIDRLAPPWEAEQLRGTWL